MNNLKKYSYSWFSKECINCLNKTNCVSGGAFHQCLRHYFLHLKGYSYEANAAMIKGKLMHENAQKDIKTIDEYGLVNFIKDLSEGKSIQLKELAICSPIYGLKGVVDIVRFQWYPARREMKVFVTELKSSFNKKYIWQLAVYGLILSDLRCMIGYTKDEKRLMQKFYPKDMKLTIHLSMKILNAGHYNQLFMVSNLLTDWGKSISAALNNKKMVYKNFQKAGVYFLHEIPRPNNCRKDCPYKPICDKYEFDSHKSKQKYFGHVKLLINTKPKII